MSETMNIPEVGTMERPERLDFNPDFPSDRDDYEMFGLPVPEIVPGDGKRCDREREKVMNWCCLTEPGECQLCSFVVSEDHMGEWTDLIGYKRHYDLSFDDVGCVKCRNCNSVAMIDLFTTLLFAPIVGECNIPSEVLMKIAGYGRELDITVGKECIDWPEKDREEATGTLGTRVSRRRSMFLGVNFFSRIREVMWYMFLEYVVGRRNAIPFVGNVNRMCPYDVVSDSSLFVNDVHVDYFGGLYLPLVNHVDLSQWEEAQHIMIDEDSVFVIDDADSEYGGEGEEAMLVDEDISLIDEDDDFSVIDLTLDD